MANLPGSPRETFRFATLGKLALVVVFVLLCLNASLRLLPASQTCTCGESVGPQFESEAEAAFTKEASIGRTLLKVSNTWPLMPRLFVKLRMNQHSTKNFGSDMRLSCRSKTFTLSIKKGDKSNSRLIPASAFSILLTPKTDADRIETETVSLQYSAYAGSILSS